VRRGRRVGIEEGPPADDRSPARARDPIRPEDSTPGGEPGEARATDTRLVRAWSMYNWSLSGWATPISTVLIGPWLLALGVAAVGSRGTLIAVGPLHLRADAYPSAMITLAALLQVALLPAVGLRADRRRSKRRWLVGTCLAGSGIALGLAATGDRAWLAAGLLFLAGSIVWSASDLAWNGTLPEIAATGDRDRVSASGSAYGYFGGGVILAIDLALLEVHHALGLPEATAVRICFVTGAAWWLLFGLPAVGRLRARPRAVATGAGGQPRPARLREELRLIRSMPQTTRFLLAYLFYADATSAVIALSSTYLTVEIFHRDTAKASPFLFGLILLVQFVAMAGSIVFGRLAGRIGSRRAVLVTLVIWCVVIFFAWAILTNQAEAVVMGLVIGLALGGTSTLSRSLFSQMVPVGREAAFFSLYEISSQGTSWVAPLIFTVVVDATGSFRQAILSLVVLFVIGIVLLVRTDTDAAAREAAEPATLSYHPSSGTGDWGRTR